MATHSADARALLDDRGYSGALLHGQNPALLIEKAVRDRITESYYWKEQCFGLNAATLCDRAAELTYIGGTYGGHGRPTPFLCLAFKMLQLVPERAIVLEYLNFDDRHDDNDDDDGGSDVEPPGRPRGAFKYLRALAAFYIRLAWRAEEVYAALEPLLSDYRRLRRRTREGYALTHVDQFTDELLTRDRACATSLWKLPPRALLEDLDRLEPRVSPLEDELAELDGSGDEEEREGEGESGEVDMREEEEDDD